MLTCKINGLIKLLKINRKLFHKLREEIFLCYTGNLKAIYEKIKIFDDIKIKQFGLAKDIIKNLKWHEWKKIANLFCNLFADGQQKGIVHKILKALIYWYKKKQSNQKLGKSYVRQVAEQI